jgi:hypothetical protein
MEENNTLPETTIKFDFENQRKMSERVRLYDAVTDEVKIASNLLQKQAKSTLRGIQER